MPIDLKLLRSSISAGTVLEPRRIFTTLQRSTRFKRPSDEQGEVLDLWHSRRTKRDCTIKMNTGSGKTLVGLLVLQSSLQEKFGPAVYLTPDKFLTEQVLSEANELGVPVTHSESDAGFTSGQKILVANVSKLINGRSRFGVKVPEIGIGSIVVDDAHSCLSIIEEKFRLRIASSDEGYSDLLKLFRPSLEEQSLSQLMDVEAEDPVALAEVPFWTWKEKQIDVMKILHPLRKSSSLEFSWPLLDEHLALCTAIFGPGRIEIAPRFVPIDMIPSFANAKRRVFMTATLADDGVLVSHLGAAPSDIADPIRPSTGGDVGDRMILIPQEVNPSITDEDTRSLLVTLAKRVNVVVIVPSNRRADEFWRPVASEIAVADNIKLTTERLRREHVGLVVFVGKYDGVDLPGRACEVLAIDGLPEVVSLSDRRESNLLHGTKQSLRRQVQRIEQGIGRGVRGSEDHCVVLLMGARLIQRLNHPDAVAMLSASTRAQMELGRRISSQLQGKPITEIADAIELCLSRDEGWIQVNREALASASHIGPASNIESFVVSLREAFDVARTGNFAHAVTIAQSTVNVAGAHSRLQGYLKQQLAEYVWHQSPVDALRIQESAIELNSQLVKPPGSAKYTRMPTSTKDQAVAALEYFRSYGSATQYQISLRATLDDLVFSPTRTERFEGAFADVAPFIGYASQRPERDFGRGPDVLWLLGQLSFLVVECKSGVTSSSGRIAKSDCNQLSGSMHWFAAEYDSTCTAVPLLVHPHREPDAAATLHKNARIMDMDAVTSLVEAVRRFGDILASSSAQLDITTVASTLRHLNLTRDLLVSHFSRSPLP